MAIIKEIETDCGITCSYHKVGRTDIIWHQHWGVIEVLSFVDKAVRKAGKNPVCVRSYEVAAPESFIFQPERNVEADAYAYIKTLPDFAGVVDDL